jgi:hypothetical protein
MQQLRQRVIASCHLGALNAADTRSYIEHRLNRAGWMGDPGLSDGAFEEIHRHSGGIPRRINSLCSRLLLLAYLEESHAIDQEAVGNVARELMAELGPIAVAQPASVNSMPMRAPIRGGGDELRVRLDRVERTAAKHDRVIVRVLDLALKYLPETAK